MVLTSVYRGLACGNMFHQVFPGFLGAAAWGVGLAWAYLLCRAVAYDVLTALDIIRLMKSSQNGDCQGHLSN